jgi:putative ABC transport system substrate-binding protein
VSRRRFTVKLIVVSVCLSLVAWHGAVVSQQAKRHIAVLVVGLTVERQELEEFRAGLRQAGYTEGRDVDIQWRFAEGDYRQLSRLAAEVVTNQSVI